MSNQMIRALVLQTENKPSCKNDGIFIDRVVTFVGLEK